MKKSIIYIVTLSMILSGFGFATAKPACASMMEQSSTQSFAKDTKAPDCCHSGACPCTIEERANDQAMPVSVVTHAPEQPIIAQTDFSEIVLSDSILFHSFIEESPPAQTPLYQLFSVYRI